MTNINIEPEEVKMAGKIARKFAYRWSAVELDDIQQHLTLWMCEHYATLERWRKEEGGMGKLNVALSREASKYCAGEQAESNGGSLEYDLQYTPKQIERALPFLWEFNEYGIQTSMPEHPSLGTIISDTQPISGEKFGEGLAIMADISSGYYSLPKDDQKILQERFESGKTFRALGKQYGISEDAARKRVIRSIERLAAKLTDKSNIHIKARGTLNGK